MSLRRLIIVCTVCFVAAGGTWLAAQPQGGGAKEPSLGDLARQLKEKRAEAAQKPSKVFTNDNLPTRPAGRGGLSVAAQMSSEVQGEEAEPTEAESAESEAAEAEAQSGEEAGPPAVDSESAGAHDEEYYRSRMTALRSQLDIHQRQLDVLEQKLSQNQMQFYGDPNKTLQQEYSRKDIVDLTEEIENKKQEIAADEQSIRDLQDQLRREGAPAGWLR